MRLVSKKQDGVRKIMRNITIYNPAAGSGKKKSEKPNPSGISHVTTHINDASEYIKKCCLEDPDTCFTVYGGDGTVCEAVNGIMQAGKGDSAILSVVPAGSGNDFVRNFPSGSPKEYPLDLIDLGDLFGVNVVNIGFDCEVVAKSESLRSNGLITGGFSYIVGVAAVLAGKFGLHLEGEMTLENGEAEPFSGEYLLCAIGNGAYYGGGFKAVPAAKTDDGLLDVLLVRRVSRAKFLSLVGRYRAGKHIDTNTLEPIPDAKDCLIYRRCKSIRVSGMERLCVDGEVIERKEITASVAPKAIRFLYPSPKAVESK